MSRHNPGVPPLCRGDQTTKISFVSYDMSGTMLPNRTTTLGQARSFTQLHKGLPSRTITLGQESYFTELSSDQGLFLKLSGTIPPYYTCGKPTSGTHLSGSRAKL